MLERIALEGLWPPELLEQLERYRRLGVASVFFLLNLRKWKLRDDAAFTLYLIKVRDLTRQLVY